MIFQKGKRIAPAIIGFSVFSLALGVEIIERGGVGEWYNYQLNWFERHGSLINTLSFSVRWPSAWYSLLGALLSLFNFRNIRVLEIAAWGLISLTVLSPPLIVFLYVLLG